jgi:hypothetical protein
MKETERTDNYAQKQYCRLGWEGGGEYAQKETGLAKKERKASTAKNHQVNDLREKFRLAAYFRTRPELIPPSLFPSL